MTTQTSRRARPVAAALALAAALTAGAAAPAQAQTRLTVAHGFQPGHTLHDQGVIPWLECVKAASGGEIAFEHFPSGAISGHKQSIDSLQGGLADLSVIIAGYSSDRLPLSGIPLLPDMGVTSTQMLTAYRRVVDAGGPFAAEYAAQGVRPVMLMQLPAYQLLSAVGPVETAAKFAGLKLRTSGGSTSFQAKALGAVPVEIGAGDMYVSMQRRTVDATILSLSSGATYKLPELIDAVSSNGSFGSGGSHLAISAAAWGRLTEAERGIFDACGREVEKSVAAYLDAQNEELKGEYAKLGVTVYEIAPEALGPISDAAARAAAEYVARLEARGLPAGDALKAYREALGE